MEDHAIFRGENLQIVCGSKEKAEEMLPLYPGAKVFPVEYVNHKWVKKNDE
ncbi:hypothetical protein VS868_11970 [Salinimicrobium sp. 3283s]|uniref:hypothetical protein n=1 Tax=Salinimicrobium sp. 3283s TaxID=3114359 RepID=UPI0031E69EC8